MHQLRWHALLQQWVAVTTARQNRPQMPADWCPFDPGSGKVPEHYDVHLYPNDFPAFSPDSEPFSSEPQPSLFASNGARGACDVVLYSPEHTLAPSRLSLENWNKIVNLWTERTKFHSENPDIAFVAVFENCGEAVGVTMPHPHGQIYAMPFVPPTVEKELVATVEFAAKDKEACLFCYLLAEELKARTRIVAVNASFVALVPYAARFPAEMTIYARRHVRALIDLSEEERQHLASLVSLVRQKYDNLYGFLMPLMMAVKQAPLRQPNSPYHLHIQFLPLQRAPKKLKYLATIETGFGTFLADTAPEEVAETLRRTEPVTPAYSGV